MPHNTCVNAVDFIAQHEANAFGEFVLIVRNCSLGNLDCDDRSYAYKSYYDGVNSGRPNTAYQWRNPRNGHYGDFRVGDYYNDPAGFRCANYTQQVYINNRPQALSGRACQQPDGTWVIVG